MTWQRRGNDHAGTAVRTDKGHFDRFGFWFFCWSGLDGNVQQLTYVREIFLAPGIGKQPIVANAVKAAWQNMQQEAAHEFGGGKCHGLNRRAPFWRDSLSSET